MQLVRPGGLLLTCSCSGLLSGPEFLRLLTAACRQAPPPQQSHATVVAGRRASVLAQTGAASDHPVASHCPETEYLHAVWMRLE
jgi:23S rRNA (cytosine1962-C5)-methyltransferase